MSTTTETIDVLYVDDNADLTDLVTTYLEREDTRITTRTAGSAKEGLDRLSNRSIDCLVSDYEMPDTNGIEFLKTVRETYPDLPFILYTGKGSEEIASKAISAGVTDYLQKTTGTDQYTLLANRITNAVESDWSHQALTSRNQELRRNKHAMDEAPIGITITDPSQEDNPIVYANTTFPELTGYASDEILGRNCRFLQGKNTDPQSVATIRAAIDRQEHVTAELRNYRKDGTEFWNRISIAPVHDDDGRVINYVGFQQDVTDHKQRKREFERANTLFSTLFDTLPQGVLAEDESRNVLAVNQQMFELFEIPKSPEGAIGADCERMAATISGLFADPEQFIDRINEVVTRQRPIDEEEIALADGRTVGRSYRPIKLSDGAGHLWVYRDITERKDRERRLKGFINIVSHDLRNPLNMANRYLTLREDCESKHLEAVEKAHERMERLIQDLLMLAWNGEEAIDDELVDIDSVVISSWETLETGNAN